VAVGVVGAGIFGCSALRDYGELRAAYRHFADLTRGSADLRTLFVAEAMQNIQRINLFADGVWALLSGIIAAIGLHGLCAARRGESPGGECGCEAE
jgi:hypothetical protein